MKTVTSRIVYENKWLRVREDTVIQQGREAPYGVVERADGAIAIPLSPDGETVMLEQDRHPTGQLSLEFPMGAVDHDEDPSVAARRELYEECRIRADSVGKVGVFYPVPALTAQRAHVFVAPVTPEAIARAHVEPNTDDIICLRRVKAADLSTLITEGAITDGFTLGALAIAVGAGALHVWGGGTA